jgi:hypothetical protein
MARGGEGHEMIIIQSDHACGSRPVSGCIISHTPPDNPVILSPGAAKTLWGIQQFTDEIMKKGGQS